MESVDGEEEKRRWEAVANIKRVFMLRSYLVTLAIKN